MSPKLINWNSRIVDVKDLRPYEKNPRRISADAYQRLVQSMQQDGYHQRILATRDNRVIGGHQRIKALKEIGIESVEVLSPDADISEEQFRRILVRDNAQFGEWEIATLGELMPVGELIELGVPVAHIPEKSEGGLTDDDAAPEPEETPVSSQGDIWVLGDHRVMCGDSTKAENVSALMDGELADMVFTDPPYGMSYGGGASQRETLSGQENRGREGKSSRHDHE